jgi:hypothetical protein
VAAVATAGAGLTGTAQAATSGTHLGPIAPLTSSAHAKATAVKSFTIPAGTRTFTSATNGTHFSITKYAGQTPQTVTCTLTVGTPFTYSGGPYGGGEEGLAEVQCTAAVYEISVEVALFENGTEVVYSINTVYSTYLAGVNTEYPLSAGDYQAGALADVYWSSPSAYSAIGPVYSPVVYLA